jgi:radical S-adenosyl methionine domain-containing protein 2
MIPAVNFHLWEPCNMRCKFCFASFKDVKGTILPKGHLPKEKAIELVRHLVDFGFEKITFVGGEPTICPWLSELMATAKQGGLTTMLVTNGSRLSEKFLAENTQWLDWIALSIDSLNDETNIAIGRVEPGKTPIHLSTYKTRIDRIKFYGYGLKINTVVNRLNQDEDMSELIEYAQPDRWKIFQVLPIKGQNDESIESLTITSEAFKDFIDRHQHLSSTTTVVPESNEAMTGSYAMVDPAGRFFDNTKGTHTYSRPILEVGTRIAIQQVNFDLQKFEERGGRFRWKRNRTIPNRITLSGPVASGKSTIGKKLAEHLGYSFQSIGNKTRAFAEAQGYSIVEFQEKCLKEPGLDQMIDDAFANECNQQDKLIVDYRLGFKFIRDAVHIYLHISEEEAVERLKKAQRKSETFETVTKRNETFRNQFLQAYNIDYSNTKNYDLIIDVEDYNSADDIVNRIIHILTPQA